MVCQPQTAVDNFQFLALAEFVFDDENHSVGIIDIRAGINFRVSAKKTEIRPGNSKILTDCYWVASR